MPRPCHLISQRGRGDLHRSPVKAPCHLACSSGHIARSPSSAVSLIDRARAELYASASAAAQCRFSSPTESRKLPANPHLAGYQGEIVCYARARQMSLHAHVCTSVGDIHANSHTGTNTSTVRGKVLCVSAPPSVF